MAESVISELTSGDSAGFLDDAELADGPCEPSTTSSSILTTLTRRRHPRLSSTTFIGYSFNKVAKTIRSERDLFQKRTVGSCIFGSTAQSSNASKINIQAGYLMSVGIESK
jgi:hypothetical protein